MRTVPFVIVPRVTVTMVALRMADTPGCAACPSTRVESSESAGSRAVTRAASARNTGRRYRGTTVSLLGMNGENVALFRRPPGRKPEAWKPGSLGAGKPGTAFQAPGLPDFQAFLERFIRNRINVPSEGGSNE
jgi:hypothetical protein